MILKRLLLAAATILFAVLTVLSLTGDVGYVLYSTLGGWGSILVALAFLVGKPKPAESRHSVITGQPEKKLYIEPGLHDMLSDDELAAVKARFTESVRRREPAVLLETWDARVRLIEQAARNGTISMATATQRYNKMLDEWRTATTSPAEQLNALSARYGLPAETPVQKENLPPLAVGPLSSAGGLIQHPVGTYLNGQYSEPPQDEPDDDVPTVEESLDGYVPEGQDDLARDLKAYLYHQVRDARTTPWTAGRKREWHVSPAWLAEVEKLRDKAGEPLYRPVKRVHKTSDGTLHGYRVIVGDQFGTPELTAI